MTKQELFLLRRAKQIKLKEIAKHLNCSISLISLYERDKRQINQQLQQKYQNFILNKI